MTYNQTLLVIAVISVSIALTFGKSGPKWKGPLIAGIIFFVASMIVHYFGLYSGDQ